ncbi:MAG: YtxH domain-containing protein [Alistipes sp.]
MKNTGICIISLVGGIVVGSALTMLFTTQSGRDMRNSIKNFIEEEIDKVRCPCKESELDE